jgi:hypothetical protein
MPESGCVISHSARAYASGWSCPPLAVSELTVCRNCASLVPIGARTWKGESVGS